MNTREIWKTIAVGALACAVFASNVQAQSEDALINKLLEKGILTQKEAQDLKSEASQTNLVSASKWKLNDAIKNIGLFGDLRLRYEYRGAENVSGSGGSGSSYVRDRFRYAARVGLRGDLFDDFYYGLRLETSSNPRSPWVTKYMPVCASLSMATPLVSTLSRRQSSKSIRPNASSPTRVM